MYGQILIMNLFHDVKESINNVELVTYMGIVNNLVY